MTDRLLAPAGALLLLGITSLASPGAEDLDVRTIARSLAPGEAVRVQVRSSLPLRAVEGEFLGRSLAFQQEDGATAWSSWAVVELDQKPVHAPLVIRATSLDGRPLSVTRPVRIVAKTFPTQELRVEPRYVTPPPEVTERIRAEREAMAAVYAIRSARPLPRVPFTRPVSGEATSAFGARRVFNGQPKDPHPGLDLRAAEGTPVRAASSGRVAAARDLYYSGWTVVLDHGRGLFTVYAHLSRANVQPEQEVERGEVLGLSGSTGRVTGPHLHWGAKIGNLAFDPTALLDARLFP